MRRKRKLFYWRWIRRGDTWISLDGEDKAFGMILILDELDDYPVFQTNQGRVTV